MITTNSNNDLVLTIDGFFNDIDSMHDAVYDAIDASLSSDQLIDLFHKLPNDIKNAGIWFGLSDTEFREAVYKHLTELKEGAC